MLAWSLLELAASVWNLLLKWSVCMPLILKWLEWLLSSCCSKTPLKDSRGPLMCFLLNCWRAVKTLAGGSSCRVLTFDWSFPLLELPWSLLSAASFCCMIAGCLTPPSGCRDLFSWAASSPFQLLPVLSFVYGVFKGSLLWLRVYTQITPRSENWLEKDFVLSL